MTQLPLRLPLPPRFGADDFLCAPSNAAALAAIHSWPGWPDAVLVVTGPPGSGKTHLAHLWAGRAGARFLTRGGIEADPDESASANAVLDGADASGWPEAALFHLLNLMRERRLSLLVTARQSPDRWGLGTADLLSRLRLAPAVPVGPPDEALVRAVLVKLFHDRQVRVDAVLIDYLALRLDRSLGVVETVVEALDAAALSHGRRITRPLAAAVLAGLRLDAEP